MNRANRFARRIGGRARSSENAPDALLRLSIGSESVYRFTPGLCERRRTALGVDLAVLDFLMKFRGKLEGYTLQLGRQGFHIPTGADHPERKAAEAILRKYDEFVDLDRLAGTSGYAEPLFRYLGSKNTISMDASSFEGAEIVHDMNNPVPAELYGQFDTIFDGGTIEHIFNAPMAFENVRKMLKIGGLFLSVNAANNQLGHGFYQYSPELMWRLFCAETGFSVELMQLVLIGDKPQPVDTPDPAVVGRRLQIGTTPGPTYLLLAARKIGEATAGYTPQQSDYSAAWTSATDAPAAPAPAPRIG